MQDGISEQVAEALLLQLTDEERGRLAKHETENKEAYLLYQTGRFHWNKRTAEAIKKSLEYFNQAIEKDPAYALAYVGLADAYLALPVYGGDSFRDSHAKAKAAARRALELDDTLAEAHTSMANALYFNDWNLAESSREFETAIALNPNYSRAHQSYGEMKGSFQEALAEYQKAYQLNDTPLVLGLIGHVYAASGRKAEALRKLDQLKEISRRRYVSEYEFAIIHAGLGDKDQALQWLEKAYQEHNPYMLLLKIDPYFAESPAASEMPCGCRLTTVSI